MRNAAIAGALVAVAAATAFPADAGNIELPGNGTWTSFAIDSFLAPAASPLRWVDEAGALANYTFHVGAGQTATLTVVDGGFAGDTFAVSSGSGLPGASSSVPIGSYEASTDIGLDFEAALADSSFSRGVFLFGQGDYSITGLLVQSVTFAGERLDSTVGGLRLSVTAPVPEPESIGLLLAGLVAMGAWMRRRNRALGR